MVKLTEEGNRMLGEIASRYNVSQGAIEHLFDAVLRGQGSQAQFNHPELGGMGQWSAGGMTMIGDMFNNHLKARVADISAELAHLSRNSGLQQPISSQSQYQGDMSSLVVPAAMWSANWWPEGLGHASSTGAQNDLRYAVFPATRRLAISIGGTVTVYDTGDHQITGFSQQQGGDQSLTFTSQYGLVRVADLRTIPQPVHGEMATPESHSRPAAETPAAASFAAAEPPAPTGDDIFTKIERLAAQHAKGILQDEEFHAKKRELLDRL